MLNADIWRALADGAWITVQVTFYAVILGTVIGMLGGVASLSPIRPLRWLARVYVEVFRGVSAIILLFWVFFALPPLLGIFLPPLPAGVIALGTNMGAYATELVRGAIQAIPKGQTEASIALNLSAYKRLRHVILPQAVAIMLPPYGNLSIEVMKASALVSLIALNDLTFEAQNLRVNRAADSLEIFVPVLLLYFAISGVITLVVRLLERRFSRGLETGRSTRKVGG